MTVASVRSYSRKIGSTSLEMAISTPRQQFAQNRFGALLMRRIGEAVEEDDGHRRQILVADLLGDPRQFLLGQRDMYRTVGQHPLAAPRTHAAAAPAASA